ncbi:DNA polymerase III subunit epsilon [Hyphobacterium sp. HN65]|uniref:DNA polymerase III subunit epsilon n=1 Tax=Hyphobacterium lacteum TaxID=3116575 RepID=A0ABU7LTG0_9PROT|nr:DNA polymerase III subunit epsilon [Hyphobacterium sp. HN65]MEE2526634.1 DNA polymerase III subunit epsilon [Hyphobacterium sp. HN65]
MREIVFDTETTGLDPQTGDRITELGCVEVEDFIPTGRTWHAYVNPQRSIPEKVTEITGLTAEFLADKPLFADVADGFLEFVGDARVVAHNAPFDRGFINMELTRIGKPIIENDRWVDTVVIARKKFPGAHASLDALCKRFGISLETRDKHGAIIDALLLADVYLELNGGRERALDLSDDRGEAGGSVTFPKRPARPEPLVTRLTMEEREAHEAFVATLGESPIWKSGGLI